MPIQQKKEKKKMKIYVPKFLYHSKMKFKHVHKELEFSCAWTATKIALDYLGFTVSESELYEMTGDKNMGTSHWEIKNVLNTILKNHNLPWRAKICSRVRLEDLEHALAKKHPVIVHYLTLFIQEGMSKNPYYPHFGLLKTIDWEKRTVQLLSPSGGGVKHDEVADDPGVVEFNISTFLDLFYARPKFLMKVEYLATRTIGKKSIGKNIKNIFKWLYNGLFIRISLIAAYCIRIIKPGTIIIIEPTTS